jgi:hypothetical protein
MALLNFTGFETGDGTELSAVSGTASIQNSTVRTGGYAVRANPTTTATGFVRVGAPAAGGNNTQYATATAYITFYFRYATKPASNSEPFFSAVDNLPNDKLSLRLNSSGNATVHNAAGTLIATGSTVLAVNTWYRIDVKVGTGGSGAWEVKINGVSEASGTASLGINDNSFILLGKHVNVNGQTVDFFYDDVWIDNAAFPTGEVAVQVMQPDGDGSSTDWTGAYTAVDELPHNSDTDFISTSTSGHVELVTLESAAAAGITGTVLAVKSIGIVRDEGGSSAFNIRLRSGGTNSNTSNNDPGTNYSLRSKVNETDPATSAAWLLAALDSIEVGVVANAAVAHRCTMLCAMVAYTPAAPGGGLDLLLHMQQYAMNGGCL